MQENSELTKSQLLRVQKPGQYLGGEHNSVQKDPSQVKVRFALAFPDLYEVGMSHVGIQLLYEIINSNDSFWAERVFMPMPDMEALLRDESKPLASLESNTPLGKFDFLGFSLQYELCATNILTMLDLAGIPFRSAKRDNSHPIVIGGGPYTYHPEPISDFFDVFLLGDAEEAIEEILNIKLAWNEEIEGLGLAEQPSREVLLKRFAKVQGVYIPSLYVRDENENGEFIGYKSLPGAPTQVVRRLLPSMEGAPYLKKPIVPNIETVHNRLSVEVMRGCVRGCRFCQAGYLYRPQRERSPEEIVEIIGEALPQSGYEELSLLSLSTADYCSVVPLLKTLMDSYAKDDKLAVSFPSTRVDSLTPEVLEQVQRVRRTGFTIAPEGGTQRIRDVINKGVSDEQILETCQNVFKMGWSGIKLYFMLGLPTETDEDLQGIVDIASRIKALPDAANKDITVSVSTHVPKPHTPFQWAHQISADETIRKQRLIAKGLREHKINYRYHNSFSSFLEGIFCRGDRELSKVVEKAWSLGGRLDAWSENLDPELWMQAFEECNINPHLYLHEKDPEKAMPWDHLSCGIPKSYFLKEWKRAIRDRATPDCLTQSCSVCGACNYDDARNVLWPRDDDPSEEKLIENNLAASNVSPLELDNTSHIPIGKARYRLKYAKSEQFSLIGHLELAHVFHRAARRAGVPLAYSRGFHPHPKLVFGPPLQLGIESDEELLDIWLTADMESRLLIDFFNQELPQGLKILDIEQIELKSDALGKSIVAYDFEVSWIVKPKKALESLEFERGNFQPFIEAILASSVTRKGKAKKQRKRSRKAPPKVVDKVLEVSNFVDNISFIPSSEGLPRLQFRLNLNPSGATIRPTELLKEISGLEIAEYEIKKTKTLMDAGYLARQIPTSLPMLAELGS